MLFRPPLPRSQIRFREYRNFTWSTNNKLDWTICRVCMINHFALIYETKVACRNYPNIISASGETRVLSLSCNHACLRLYGSTYTNSCCYLSLSSLPLLSPYLSYSLSYSDVALVKLNRESIVSLFRSGRCYKLRQFIVSRAQSNLKDPPSGRIQGRSQTDSTIIPRTPHS